MLFGQLPVPWHTRLGALGCRTRGGRPDGIPRSLTRPEVRVCGRAAAHARRDPRGPARAPLLPQRPGDLLPVEVHVGGVLRTGGRPGDVLAAEAPAPLPARDTQDEGVLAGGGPRALGLVFDDHLALQGVGGDGRGLAARLGP